MRSKLLLPVALIAMMLISCKQEEDSNLAENDTNEIFPKGDKITNNNFVGDASVQMLITADSTNRNSVGNVTFAPGARTNWHSHPNGQIILALEGTGYYQEKGSKKRILRKGDVVKCPANLPHWHGAGPESEFVQLAITSRVSGPTEWLEAVTDEQYRSDHTQE